MIEAKPKQEVSALQTLLDTINYQKQTIDYLTSRIIVLENRNDNLSIDYWNIRNTPNFVYNIVKENDTLKIEYFNGHTDLIPLNNKYE